MLFRPREESWADPRALGHDGTFSLHYVVEEDGVGIALGLARSHDGVHWVDRDRILERREGVGALGVGGAFRAPTFEHDGRFLLALSERPIRGAALPAPVIRLAESHDLAEWRYLGNEYVFRPDPRWYRAEGNSVRWGDFCCLPRPTGGRYAYWTADPAGGEVGFGFGESMDCCHWRALPPPKIVWGDLPAPHTLRMGGVVRSRGRYHVFVEGQRAMRGESCVYHLMAERPGGPFSPAIRNTLMLSTTAPGGGVSLGVVETDDEALVIHLATTCRGERWLAPLKRLTIAEDGAWLTYWRGNDRLRGAPLRVTAESTVQGPTGLAITMLGGAYDVGAGLVLEGRWEGLPQQGSDAFRGAGFYVETAPGEGTGLLVPMRGETLAGPMSSGGESFSLEDAVDRHLEARSECAFRLLLRGELAELYLDDILMNSIALRGPATGRIGLVGAAVRDLRAHQLDL